ncbi:MAG: hypothetical protein ACM3UN_00655 [Bacillota bacterium]
MKLKGSPLNLDVYETSEVLTNKHFKEFQLSDFERLYLPPSMQPFTNLKPLETKEFIVDDNRGAVSAYPNLKIDNTNFYLSIKGVGSATHPFSRQVLGKAEVCASLRDSVLRERIVACEEMAPRYLTGELWLRGSPYGGQGLEHANTALKVSEMADITSINGFRVAPLMKIVFLPFALEREVKKVFWYRQFKGRIVQETRLVPSNVRIHFHSGSTIGGNIRSVFDLFGIDTDDKAINFLKNFLKSGIAFLTLFARTLKHNQERTYSGLDFYDVWLDKDAVLAPDGTIFFVDLEGLEWIIVGEEKIPEKIDDQIYRSLFEFMYAYEQIQRERSARFGVVVDRSLQFEILLRSALENDEVVSLASEGQSLKLEISNILGKRHLTREFTILER